MIISNLPIKNTEEYLPLDGSLPMTGKDLWLRDKYGLVYSDEQKTLLESINSTENTDNCRGISISNSNGESNLSDAIRFYERKDGILTRYNLYGEHNLPMAIKTYGGLGDLNLTNDSEGIVATDFLTTMTTMITAMSNRSIFTGIATTSAFTNLYNFIL